MKQKQVHWRGLKRESGFSLLELVATVFLYLALFSCAAISIAPLLETNRLRSEARRLEVTLQRLALASRHYEQDLSLQCAKGECQAYLRTASLPLLRHLFSKKISVRLKSGQSDKLVFYKTGSASPATFELALKRNSCRVVVSLEARIRSTC